MRKILMIFAAMAAMLSSCSKSDLESATANESKDIVLNISVSAPGDDTKALIKTGWAENDEISIWYDENMQENPDLVVTYNGEKWIQKQDATVSENTPSQGENKYVKSLYNGKVKVASKDNYTYDGTTLTFNIANWKFLTELQVVVKGLASDKASDYTLACDKFTPLAAGNGYTVNADVITASSGTKGDAVTGISNTDGVAFVFATAEYSTNSEDKKDFAFTLKDNTSGIEVTKFYKPSVAIVAKEGKSSIKALTIESGKFAVPVNPYVEIEADYDNDPSTDNTTLKWYRQNLAISDSGKKAWKGDNVSGAVKVPGTNEDVKVGDYFQWAAHAGYCGDASAADKGLLIYESFTNKYCVDGGSEDKFEFKSDEASNKYKFNTSRISPYYSSSAYTYYTDTQHSTLSRETTYSGYNDDVANIILGDNWRMPTSAEFQAMREVTYWAWDAKDFGYYVFKPGEGTSGAANGRGTFNTSTDDKSKALLFFPDAGIGLQSTLEYTHSCSDYWSSSLCSSNPKFAHSLEFTPLEVSPQASSSRYCGCSVRPVSD